jgi:hypothetical protein
MDDRELGQLMMERTTPELLEQLLNLVKNASEATKHMLADSAITTSQIGTTVFAPVNGFILYLLCLDEEQVSVELLQEYYHLIEPAVCRRWTVSVKGLGPKEAFDPILHDLAMRTYRQFVKLTK